MIVSAFYMPFFAISHCAYLPYVREARRYHSCFDSAYTWGVIVPVAYLIAKYADFDIYTAYPVCYFPDVLKSVLGLYIIKKGRWAQNIVLTIRALTASYLVFCQVRTSCESETNKKPCPIMV